MNPNQFSLQQSAAAMCVFAQSMRASEPFGARNRSWADALIPAIEAEREQIRIAEQGGGMCHLMTEWLWHLHGWTRIPVTYLSAQGEPICAGHLINILPDCSILDTTADQFGEGYSVRVVSPDHRDYGRYRPEFDVDFNPAQFEELHGFYWNGVNDFDYEAELRQARGYGWWVQDKQLLARYLAHQISLGCTPYETWLQALLPLADCRTAA